MLSRKNVTLFSLVFSLIVGSGLVYSYIQMYQPVIKEIMKLRSSITTVKNEVSTLDVSKKVDTAELLTNTANLQKKLPVAELSDQFVLLLEKAEVASGSRIISIAFNKGDNTEAANTTAEQNIAAAEKANQDAQKAMDLTADTPTSTTLPAGVKKLTVTLSVESPSYVELESFIKELEELPRITKVENLSFSGVAEGDTSNVLTYTVVASTYYFPELTDLKNQLPDYEAPAPSKKTNPLYKAEEGVNAEVPQTNDTTNENSKNDPNNTKANGNSQTNSQQDTKVIKKNGKQYKVNAYQVQPGDTFFDLAVKFYNNNKGIELIKSWNNITELQTGVTIEIPIPVDGEI